MNICAKLNICTSISPTSQSPRPLGAIAKSNLISYICTMMYLDSILDELKNLKPELSTKYFVDSIGLFGSITRNDFTDKSDIDIIVDFKKPIGIEFVDLAEFLEKKFNRKVDLVSKNGMKQNFYSEIKNEIHYV